MRRVLRKQGRRVMKGPAHGAMVEGFPTDHPDFAQAGGGYDPAGKVRPFGAAQRADKGHAGKDRNGKVGIARQKIDKIGVALSLFDRTTVCLHPVTQGMSAPARIKGNMDTPV